MSYFSGHKSVMRKTGNGHNVDVETFLDDLKTVLRDGQELLKAGAEDVRGKALYGARKTDKAIRQSPYRTIALIFGLGIIVGLVASGMSPGGHLEIEE